MEEQGPVRQLTLRDLRKIVYGTEHLSGDVPIRLIVNNDDWGRVEILPLQRISFYQPTANLVVMDFESSLPEED